MRLSSQSNLSALSTLWKTGCLALSFGLLASLQNGAVFAATANLANEEPAEQPTPLNEFAPESVKSPSTNQYDQSVTISRVQFEGNRLIPDGQIQEVMAIRPGSLYSKKTLQDDLRRIYGLGYFTDELKAVPVATRNGIVLSIKVEENVPVTGVNIEGNTQLPADELEAVFTSQTGLPQNINQLNESIDAIQKRYSDKGYVLARVASITDDPDGQITLQIKEGMIGDVQFVGNRKTKDFVLKRAMLTQAGQPYNEKVLTEDLKRLFATQAFEDVRRVITVSPDDVDKYNLVVEVDEKRTGAISIGGGLDTGTGVFGSVGYNDPNFLGRGESFNTAVSIGSGVIGRDNSQANARTYQFETGWSTPSLAQTDNALSASLFARDFGSFNVPLGIERRIGAETVWARAINSLPNTSFSLGLRGENIKVREGGSLANLARLGISPTARTSQLESGTFISLTPTLAYDTRDNRFSPDEGWFNTVSTGGTLGLSGDSYGTLSANVRRYIKLKEGVTLALNGQLASSVLGDIPDFNQFRLGGSYSVRGWQEGGLGIGSGFLNASAELRTHVPFIAQRASKIPFLDSLRLAFFVDAGTLFNESDINSLIGRDGYGISTGLGLRVNLPGVGPLRLDYAIPISGGNSEFYRKFNFGIGQKF